MILQVCYFTRRGEELAHTIEETKQFVILHKPEEMSWTDWVQKGFERQVPILFIGATGIAVRMIAPYVKDKLSDSPVVVMDEKGQYTIPLLSGHVGGANELAGILAKMVRAQAVYTTATDVEEAFSVDVFAKKNGFHIQNREGIRTVSAKILRNIPVTIAIDPAIRVLESCTVNGVMPMPFETEKVDIRMVCADNSKAFSPDCQELLLVAREYVCGVGCKRGKSFEELQAFLLEECPFDPAKELYALATIDLKEREEGLLLLSAYYHVPFFVYSAEELMQVEGDFAESDFVREITGVSNVCERAAIKLSGTELFTQKRALNGMTLAISKRRPQITTWETN